MTTLAQAERAAISDLAAEVGPNAPTLCEGWDTRHLMAHLILREGHPSSLSLAIPGGSKLSDWFTQKWADKDYADLVSTFRKGAPFYSPMSISKVDALFNGLEFFVHHEDIRRAQPDWAPRELPLKTENAIWRALRSAGRMMLRSLDFGVLAARSDTGAATGLKSGEPSVVIQGLPSEIALFVFGRQTHARVTLDGDPDLIAKAKGRDLGV